MTRPAPTVTDHPSALVSVPVERVQRYLARLKKSRQHDQERIHAFDLGEPSEAELFASDLEALVLAAAPAAPQAAGVGDWINGTAESPVGSPTWCAWATHEIMNLRAPSREPEGGAVWFGVTGAADEIEALAVALFDARCPGVRMTDEDLHYYRAAAQRAMRAVADELDTPALATREEAPAEAGEIGAEYDAAAHCVTLAECPPGLFLWNGTLGFKSEYGAMEPVGISPHHQQWKVGNRADAYCADSGEYFWGGTSNHDDRAKLLVYPASADAVAMVASHGPSALRAQPQAREDAQPFAWAYRLNFPDENTAWDWQVEKEKMTEAKFGPHGGILETAPLYTHPAPDALRVAVEAFMPSAEVAFLWSKETPPAEEVQRYRERYWAVKEAIAALQAEQGAK